MSDANIDTSAPAPAGAPPMTTPETLVNIFFEPEGTFAALRERPRFLVAALIILLLSVGTVALVMQKVNFTEFITRQINAAQMSDDQKAAAIQFWSGPLGAAAVYGMPVVAIVLYCAAGGGLYLLAALAMGGRMGYRQALSVWVYSSLPPAVVGSLVSVVLLLIKPAEEIDLDKPGAGLAVTNLGALLGPDSSAPLRAALGWFDVFTFYGMFLAAVGLRKVGRLSAASAWTVIIVFWVLCVAFGVIRALIAGK